ncbi:PucR family transcriptional regulator [Virgibacillus senegalensis]|uniref:PucR family transcriptional regulator n=1 Tax=Virgibacillus senegalensis TaxID=1499679 RepID=UPI00069DAE9B|nr:helix-turn-helix domain-containing protein [Virgibacillus senegalensis]
MIDNLRAVFPGLITYHPGDNPNIDAHRWFTTDEKEIVGIPNEELTEKDLLLLQAFLKPYHFRHAAANQQELAWADLLLHGASPDHLTQTTEETHRFVYFYLSEANIEPGSFREAIAGFYPETVPIIWLSTNEGVIVETDYLSPGEEEVSYGQITDLLMSDFYTKVHLFIGPTYSDLSLAQNQFQIGMEWFKTVRSYDNNPVITFIDAVPYLFLDKALEYSEEIVSAVFQDTIEEKELLTTIQTFLECNSNATMASKKLYMHRNSLQYRVDKFIEKTGIDVKQFKGALTVYLALILKKNR